MTPGTLEGIIRKHIKHIGNIGNRPSVNTAIDELAFNLYSNHNIKTKAQVLFSIEILIGNRKDLVEAYYKMADELVEAMEKVS